MKTIQLKTILIILRIILLVQLMLHQHQFEVEATEIGSKLPGEIPIDGGDEILKERMKEIEVQSKRQEKEIDFLKTNADEDRKKINKLESRVAQLEAASTVTNSLVRSKRPYRLLPVAFVKEEMNNGEHHSQFYGPATSCAHLAEIGYTLNGYYLTRSKEQQPSSGGNVDVVHCKFQQSQQRTKGIEEERLGHIVLSRLSMPDPIITTSTETMTQTPLPTDSSFNYYELANVGPIASTLLEIDTETPTTEIVNKNKDRTEVANNIESTSSLPEITTKTEQPDCDFNHQIFHLKNEEQGFCLVMGAQSNLFLSECDIFSLEQQWIKLKLPYRGMYISIDYNDDSTIVSPSISTKKQEVRLIHLRPRFNTSSNHQQWGLTKKTGLLWNVDSELCLVAYSKNQKKSAASLKVGIETCLKNNPTKSQKWSFVRFQDENNVALCFVD